jgi:hypothetical protein
MKSNSLMLLAGTVVAESMLWLVAPGLATMAGVVLALFTIASWREGHNTKHPRSCTSFNVDDFQRRSGISAL